MDVRTLMRQSAEINKNREAVVYGDRRLTYREAWNRGLRFANGLLAMGLKPGDHVGVLENNSLQAQDTIAGTTVAGIVRVPLYARNTTSSHLHMLRNTSCRGLIVAAELEAEVSGILDELPDLEVVLLKGDDYEQWLALQSDEDPDVVLSPDDLYIIRHSGGTTGVPKGVASTHRMWI